MLSYNILVSHNFTLHDIENQVYLLIACMYSTCTLDDGKILLYTHEVNRLFRTSLQVLIMGG